MPEDRAPVPGKVITELVAELERRMEEACAKWSLTKSHDPMRFAAWHSREVAYREALGLLADAGLAPAKYAPRRS